MQLPVEPVRTRAEKGPDPSRRLGWPEWRNQSHSHELVESQTFVAAGEPAFKLGTTAQYRGVESGVCSSVGNG